MTLCELLEVTGSDTVIHIGTDDGHGWLFSDTTEHLLNLDWDWLLRPVVEQYYHIGREEHSTCCALKPGVAVIIEGRENGII